MERITIKNIQFGSADYQAVWQLREEVLRIPLGLSLKDEDLSAEAIELIFGLFYDGDIAACTILKPISPSVIKLRQMAVSNKHQQKGLGRELLLFAEQYARQHNYQSIVLHARDVAIGFYEKAGYQIAGDGFMEVNIPHHKMIKNFY